MAASRIKGITVEIGGDTTKLQTALKGVNSEIKKDTTYRIAKTLGYLCGLILVVGVWPRH